MEYDQIKKLIEDMGNSNLTSINIEFPNGLKLNMEKNPNGKSSNNTNDNLSNSNINQVNSKSSLNPNLNANSSINTISNVNENNNLNNDNNNQEQNENKNVHIVKSPMVGTFYSKSAPDAKPYVEVGTSVKEGDTLCIIEAMKLMNEIESEFTGKIYKILVSDGTPVEYGTPLFEIED